MDRDRFLATGAADGEASPPPLRSTWHLPSGFGSTHVSPEATIPFPRDIAHARIGFQSLADGSGFFNLDARFFKSVTVKAKIQFGAPILALRISSSGGTSYQPSGATPVLEEKAGNYSLSVVSEANSVFHHRPGETTSTLVVALTVERLRALLDDTRPPSLIRHFLDGRAVVSGALFRATADVGRIVEQLRAPIHTGAMAALHRQSLVCGLLARALANLAGTEDRPGRVFGPDLHKAMAARDRLIADPACPPSIEALARQFGLSRRRLNEIFRERFGMSVFAWLVDWRLTHARELLLDGSLPVKEVAFRAGYAHPSNFAIAFTSRFGVTPAAFRQASRSIHPMAGSP